MATRLVLGERINASGRKFRWIQAYQASLLSGGCPKVYLDRMKRIGSFNTRANKARLRSIGLVTGRSLDCFDFMAPAEQADPWNMTTARHMAGLVWMELFTRYELVFLTGARLRNTFGLAGEDWFTLHEVVETGSRVVLLPHPSGRCRFWNDKDAVQQGRLTLERLNVVPRERRAVRYVHRAGRRSL